MSVFSRLFGARSGSSPDDDLEQKLRRLEAEADVARPGYLGSAFNRAGDLAHAGDLRDRAAEYYGRAIDAFLEDGQREAARGVANKILRVRPGAARTLCTLVWLDLGARHSATALLHLRDYVAAAKQVNQQSLASNQIYSMARLVPDAEFIEAAADALDALDHGTEANEVREWVLSAGSPDSITDPERLAQACMEAAVRSNQRGARTKPAGSRPQGARADVDESAGKGEGRRGETRGGKGREESKKYRWE